LSFPHVRIVASALTLCQKAEHCTQHATAQELQ
jgi:hypothetical protein